MEGKVTHTMPNEHIYDGRKYMGITPVPVLDAIKKMTLRDDDVIIVTYPKAGTTWMCEILWLMLKDQLDPSATVEGASNRVRVPIIEIKTVEPTETGPVAVVESRKSPRVFATHLPPEFFESELRRTKARVILMTRNPKDTLVSFYHFYRATPALGSFTGTFNEFMQLTKQKDLQQDFFDFHAEWWPLYKELDNIYSCSFEELKREPKGEIKKIAKFLGIKVDDKRMDEIVEKTSFDKMSKDPTVNKENAPAAVYNSKISKYMRKGQVGDWKGSFTVSNSEWVDAQVKDILEPLGLTFTYEL